MSTPMPCEYIGMASRKGPPSSAHTGRSKSFPARSHSAMSMPLIVGMYAREECVGGGCWWKRVFVDVFIAPRRGRADVVELLGVLDAIVAAEFAVSGEHELLDIGALGGDVVVAEQRQAEIARPQLLAQARAVAAARALGPV